MSKSAFTVGQQVEWTSSNTRKLGVVSEIIPPGCKPEGIKGIGLSRGQESYVVTGGIPGEKDRRYWPVVSLLKPMDGLTPDEVAWCHANVSRIRDLMGLKQGARV